MFHCDFDFFYYPFDQQTCSASLFASGYGESEIIFTLIQHETDRNRNNTFLSSPHLCFNIVFSCDLFVSLLVLRAGCGI